MKKNKVLGTKWRLMSGANVRLQIPSDDSQWHVTTLKHSTSHCNTLQHTATHCAARWVRVNRPTTLLVFLYTDGNSQRNNRFSTRWLARHTWILMMFHLRSEICQNCTVGDNTIVQKTIWSMVIGRGGQEKNGITGLLISVLARHTYEERTNAHERGRERWMRGSTRTCRSERERDTLCLPIWIYTESSFRTGFT